MKCQWLDVSPAGVCVVVNASASHNTLTAPEQTHCIAIDLSINSCGSFYQIYCSNIECLIIREVYRSPESSAISDGLKWTITQIVYGGRKIIQNIWVEVSSNVDLWNIGVKSSTVFKFRVTHLSFLQDTSSPDVYETTDLPEDDQTQNGQVIVFSLTAHSYLHIFNKKKLNGTMLINYSRIIEYYI